jgi:hypothetical protein
MTMSYEELVELYREVQTILRRGGGPVAIAAVVDLEREMVRALDIDPWDDAAMDSIMRRHDLIASS